MCCPLGALGFLEADHKEEGRKSVFGGVDAYVSGEIGKKVVVAIPDVWGWNTGRIRAIADGVAKQGGTVVIPQVLDPVEGGHDGDGLPPTFNMATRRGELGGYLHGIWSLESVVPKVKKLIDGLAAEGVEEVAFWGFCYGGWVAMEVSAGDLPVSVVCGVICHPSNHIGSDPAAQAARSKCPWILLPAGDPHKETPGCDPAIYDADGTFFQALEARFPGKNESHRFPRQPHGWVARGNLKLPGTDTVIGGECVAEDIKQALQLVFAWLKKHNMF